MNLAPAPELPDWLSEMVPFKRYRVAVDNYLMHVMETGEGPTVLALHGDPTWGFLYRKVATQLAAQGFRVVMPDLFGLGLSSKPRNASAHTLARHAEVMTKLFDALDLRDYLFIGQDWGGPIGLLACGRAQVQPSGLIILNTVISPPKAGFKATTFHKFARLPVVSDLAFRGINFTERFMPFAQGERSSISGDVARAYLYPTRKFRENVAPLALARMVPNNQQHPSIPSMVECQDFVTSFSGPIACVWGRKDPILGGVIKHVRKILPDANITETGAGHFIQEESVDEICEATNWVSTQL